MSIFSGLFGNSDHQQQKTGNVQWIALTHSRQIQEIIESSHEKPVLIFKHSTRCGISRMVLKDFEKQFNPDLGITCYFLDLLTFRDLSNDIARCFQVVHQSPQLLLIKDGICIYDASHSTIDASGLAAKL